MIPSAAGVRSLGGKEAPVCQLLNPPEQSVISTFLPCDHPEREGLHDSIRKVHQCVTQRSPISIVPASRTANPNDPRCTGDWG